MKIAWIVGAAIALGIGIAEITLRLLFGFGRPLLYVADTQVGYRLAPNQRTRRFGNRIVINQYSMRSPAIAPCPKANTLRVLLLGDSIANGGWWTDQADILSAQIQRQLSTQTLNGFTAVEVLNASANSWGPRNELAYLAKFGTFGAQVVVVLLNTDDLFATAPTSAKVGRDRAYPTQYPSLALAEVLSRFRQPQPTPELEALRPEGGDRVGANLEAVRQLQHITHQASGKFILAMTPLRREVIPPGCRDYEVTARKRLLALARREPMSYVDFLIAFENVAEADALYRDHIHLSPQGNAIVSQLLSRIIRTIIEQPSDLNTPLPDSLLDDPW